MAEKLNLMANESIVLKDVGVAHEGSIYTNELILTNLNIILINKGMLGKTKSVDRFPLNQIKILDGKPQVLQGKKSNGSATLDIVFVRGVESFSFQSQSNISKWIKAITNTLGYEVDESRVNDDSGTLIGAFKSIKSGVMDAIGIKQKEKIEEKITKKCISCSAPLVGVAGQVVKCKYCDTSQTL
ncbi:hypothetical protein SAMN04487934_1056 [Eubacterium ruminantium]|nr:hypothetical protein SAMN04487934_1056 [Eubacterium ruminantium]